MNPILWLPAVLLYYAGLAWLSLRSSESGGSWSWGLYAYGALCPLWVLISRVSQDLWRDGLVYDAAMMAGYVLGLWWLGAGSGFGLRQWAGVLLLFTGAMMLKR